MLSLLTNRPIILIILGILFLQKNCSGGSSVGLSKRSLLTFPPSSLLQINIGVTLTGDFERNSAAIALAFQQYSPLPEGTRPLYDTSVLEKKAKFSIYQHLTDVISSYGFNGSECLRRMICQIGESPLMGGLLEDIVTLALTPSRHRNVSLNESSLEPLLESEDLGRKGGNCTLAFPGCAKSPLDFISTLIHF